jgi:hypothetical protein
MVNDCINVKTTRLRWYQYSLRSLLIFTTLFAIIISLLTWAYQAYTKPSIVAKLDCGNGRVIVIMTWRADMSELFYVYDVYENERNISYQGSIESVCRDPEFHHYEVVKSNNGSLVCVVKVYNNRSLKPVIVHDFHSGKSWAHYDISDISFDPRDELMERYNRLRQENPRLPPIRKM